jgi:hypothetical protein
MTKAILILIIGIIMTSIVIATPIVNLNKTTETVTYVTNAIPTVQLESATSGSSTNVSGTSQDNTNIAFVNNSNDFLVNQTMEKSLILKSDLAGGAIIFRNDEGTDDNWKLYAETGNTNLVLGTGAGAGNFIPETDNLYGLGTALKQWRNLYMAGNLVTTGNLINAYSSKALLQNISLYGRSGIELNDLSGYNWFFKVAELLAHDTGMLLDMGDYSDSGGISGVGLDLFVYLGNVLTKIDPNGNLWTKGYVNATTYYGDGSHLTGIVTDEDYGIINQSDGFSTTPTGSSIVTGITHDATGFWMTDNLEDFVYHTNLLGVNQTGGFSTASIGSGNPHGIIIKGSDFWILDGDDDFVYHTDSLGVNQSDGFYVGSIGITDGWGMTTDGTDFWITDYIDDFVYHLDSTGANQTDGFGTRAFGSNSPYGIEMDGTDFWITDYMDLFIYHVDGSGVNQTDGFGTGFFGGGNVYSLTKIGSSFWIDDYIDKFIYHITYNIANILQDNTNIAFTNQSNYFVQGQNFTTINTTNLSINGGAITHDRNTNTFTFYSNLRLLNGFSVQDILPLTNNTGKIGYTIGTDGEDLYWGTINVNTLNLLSKSIYTRNIVTGAVTNAELGTSAVTSVKISNYNVFPIDSNFTDVKVTTTLNVTRIGTRVSSGNTIHFVNGEGSKANVNVSGNITIGRLGNITMYSPDGTKYTCGVANGGAFSCS